MTERRRFLRFPAALSALCEMVNTKCKGTYKVRNISKEGALLELDKPLRQGEELNLTMEIPGDNIPIYASGRIAWQKEATGKRYYDTGIKFTNIHSSDKGRLLEFIYLAWLKLLDGK